MFLQHYRSWFLKIFLTFKNNFLISSKIIHLKTPNNYNVNSQPWKKKTWSLWSEESFLFYTRSGKNSYVPFINTSKKEKPRNLFLLVHTKCDTCWIKKMYWDIKYEEDWGGIISTSYFLKVEGHQVLMMVVSRFNSCLTLEPV